MLIVKNKEGILYSLLSTNNEKILKNREKQFYCPCCGSRVFLKAGKIKVAHFAHKANESCSYATEGETEEHLLGKQLLYTWLRKQNLNVQMEKFFPSFKQRADLYVENDGKKFAIEYQCSIISPEDIKKRTVFYRKNGVTPIWILSSRHLKIKRPTEYILSAFQWYTSAGTIKCPIIRFFSPYTQQFTILQQLTPFSSRSTFSNPQTYPVNQLTFQHLLSCIPRHFSAIQKWMNKKQLWRQSATLYVDVNHPFFKSIYLEKIFPSTFPNEIGIPVPYMHLYETNAIHWQFWIYKNVISKKAIGDTIYLHECQRSLIQSIKEKFICLRILPYFSSINPLLPMKYYIQMLVRLEFLEEMAPDVYVLKRKVELYNPAFPEREKMFNLKVANIYEELMKNANDS
ncbi:MULTISPECIES: competence protein CoiA family protein [Bacillus]|uniref:competence protein CoiA family protein n=1 Tax=Bacillus TaxID=1386 RepID=UPI000314482B|nr:MULTISPECIES: competence protein CoiA family protein [Bacillus]